MKTFKYKSLIISENASGLKEIHGQKGRMVESEVLPDTIDYVREECNKGAILCVNGILFYVYPSTSVEELVEKWKYEHFRASGIEL